MGKASLKYLLSVRGKEFTLTEKEAFRVYKQLDPIFREKLDNDRKNRAVLEKLRDEGVGCCKGEPVER